jgi:Fe-S-cluster containining protein
MKSIDSNDIDNLPGSRLKPHETFSFRCYPGIGCFNRCCRNLNLFLYPYDVLRLKNNLNMSSDAFLDQYVDVVLRDGNSFPDVLLRMREDNEKTCPFLNRDGCRVYPDRPDTCRTFPVEQGVLYDHRLQRNQWVHFFRPPDFCLGQYEQQEWTAASWEKDQAAEAHHRMTARWAEVKRLFQSDPWGVEGPHGAKAKMAFMSTYNMDRFREFVLHSSFLKRYKLKSALIKTIETDDVALLKLGMDWVKLFVWGIPSKKIRPR